MRASGASWRSHQATLRRIRITDHARSDTARRSPEPMKRRARKKSFATASAGRLGWVSIWARSSIEAAMRAAGVMGSGCVTEWGGKQPRQGGKVGDLGHVRPQIILTGRAGAVQPEHTEAEGMGAERVPGVG